MKGNLNIQACRHRKGACGRREDAFTLIELLVIVTCIILLLGIAGPASQKAYELVGKRISIAYIHQIEHGVEVYKTDFGNYPPSAKGANGHLPDWQGAELLVLLMTGYAGDANDDGAPGNDFSTDDGCSGSGFRTILRGQVCGPYVEVDRLPFVSRDEGGTTRRTFLDKFQNSILYYRFDTTSSAYRGDDNTGLNPPADINAYAKSGTVYLRMDYLLISKGLDKQWQTASGAAADDITNMKAD